MKYTYKTIDGVTYWSKQKSTQLKDFCLVLAVMFVYLVIYIDIIH